MYGSPKKSNEILAINDIFIWLLLFVSSKMHSTNIFSSTMKENTKKTKKKTEYTKRKASKINKKSKR